MSSDPAALDISALLLPVTGKLLIVPSVVVEEIIKRRELDSVADGPHWLLGNLGWRDEQIPVISVEVLNGGTMPDVRAGSRLVIMNSLSEQSAKRHYAILTQGVPHLLRLMPEDVIALDETAAGPAERMVVNVHGQLAAIPDLDFLERHLPES